MKLDAVHALSTASLHSLASSLRGGTLSAGITAYPLQQIAGPGATALGICLTELVGQGFSLQAIALLVEGVAQARERIEDPASLLDLVLSGPDVPGIPTADTAATIRALIEEAQSEILLAGYAVHNGAALFAPLASRMQRTPSLKVTFCLDIRRPQGDTSLDSEVVWRFAKEFREKHWPWEHRPRIFFDPRSLIHGAERAALHAKCVVVDGSAALVTSANFTEAAQKRNIEVGVLIRYSPLAGRLAAYFHALIFSGQLVECAVADGRS